MLDPPSLSTCWPQLSRIGSPFACLTLRLDNIIFRLGLAPTIMAAKQLVSHGHILVNGKEVNISSFSCQPKDELRIKNSFVSQELIKKNIQLIETLLIPQHLSFDKNSLEAKVISYVNRKSISLVINELLVVEYYSLNYGDAK